MKEKKHFISANAVLKTYNP